MTFKNRFAASSAIVVAAAMLAQPAFAADAVVADAAAAADDAADSAGGLDDIVVTAQKRETNLQDTPIAISVISGNQLADRHAQSLVDLGDGAIPSLRIAPFFSRPGALIVNVRGLGVLSDSNQPGRDQGVGVYIDGVYLGRPQGLGASLFEIQNIEVLKGPQGTLFGRNTMGGAVNITTRRPSGEYRLNVTAGLGNYGSYDGVIHLDMPRLGNLSAKIDAIVSYRGGLVDNPEPGQSDYNSYRRSGVHGELLWEATPELTLDLSYDRGRDLTTTLFQQFIGAPYAVPASGPDNPAIAANIVAAATPVQPNRVNASPIGAIEQPSIGNTEGVRFNIEWQVTPDLQIKSISSYRHLTQGQFDNAGAASSFVTRPTASFTNAFFQRYSLAFFRQNQVSQELQAVGELGRVQYAFGALFFRERVQDSAQAPFVAAFNDAAGSTFRFLPGNVATAVVQRASYVRSDSIGVYGQATWNPPIANDMFHLTAGARWTRDSKLGSLFTINGARPTIPVNGVNVTGPIGLDASWSRVDPLVNLSADLSQDIMVYGRYSTGYRSGGANSRSLSYAAFDPETVSMYELGAKLELFDRHVRLNVAGYLGDYNDIQLDFSGQYEDFVNGVRVVTTRTTTDTVNAPGTGKVRGAEAELTIAPFDGLTLSASYAYNFVSIPDTVNPFPQTINGVVVSVTAPQRIYQVYTPANAASGSIDYEHDFGTFKLRAHMDGNYSDGFYANYTDALLDTRTRAVRVAQPLGDAAFVVNGRLSLVDFRLGSDSRLAVSAWARNLFNEQHVFYRFTSPTAGTQGFFNDQRTFGFDVTVSFGN